MPTSQADLQRARADVVTARAKLETAKAEHNIADANLVLAQPRSVVVGGAYASGRDVDQRRTGQSRGEEQPAPQDQRGQVRRIV